MPLSHHSSTASACCTGLNTGCNNWSRHFKIRRAADCLRRGGVLAYPTEAVWGLGCDPWNPQAVSRLLQIKQRDPCKGLILVAADIAQLSFILKGLDSELLQRLNSTWPGPVTWLVPDTHNTPAWIRGRYSSVALRVSNHPVVKGLCEAVAGPIVSTSANPQGKPPALTALSVRRYFHTQLDYITPGQVGSAAKPSEIRDLISGEIQRPG